MRFCSLPTTILALASVVESAALQSRDLLQDLQDQALATLKEAETNGTLERRAGCNILNAPVRRNWDFMSAKERKAYSTAVKCMYTSPSKSDPTLVPGARTRYDDFVGQHINQTRTIHGTGNFLSWHRYFVHSFENALREECGYTGYQPYWNWFSYQDDLSKSPVFDGSATSMGGDGYYVKHNGSTGGGGRIYLPSGNGGGCIKSGPFKNVQLNLGPVSPTMAGANKSASALAWNPRCAKRDLTNFASKTWFTFENLYNITLGAASKDISSFQNELQGRFTDGFLGLHASGHFAIGGDSGDLYSSVNDPVFFMHHAMLDRVWWIWQALHLDQAKSVEGSRSMLDPNGPRTTLDDAIETNWLNTPDVKISDVMSTLSGEPLCYIYL
ncbi:unnamed protein product [Alternaria alternata]